MKREENNVTVNLNDVKVLVFDVLSKSIAEGANIKSVADTFAGACYALKFAEAIGKKENNYTEHKFDEK